MHTPIFAVLKQVDFIQDQFLCKTTFQRTFVKSFMKSTVVNLKQLKNVFSNFSDL